LWSGIAFPPFSERVQRCRSVLGAAPGRPSALSPRAPAAASSCAPPGALRDRPAGSRRDRGAVYQLGAAQKPTGRAPSRGWTLSARGRGAAAPRRRGRDARAETSRPVRPGGPAVSPVVKRHSPHTAIAMRAAWRTSGSARRQPQETEEPQTSLLRLTRHVGRRPPRSGRDAGIERQDCSAWRQRRRAAIPPRARHRHARRQALVGWLFRIPVAAT
jgi:hypothetical protein